ncbi:MAG TPA: peptide chain release factor N(5)-glutamine methyltransferase [Blastocatellia bacterium]|jgi:release factor glutamine methyltransferase|nr:peptide chain release factor N(5)-glutamine methyltransferase [Blastocatellia bacterium]
MRSSGKKGWENGATISETLKAASESLRAASVPNDLLDAQTLLAEALGEDRTYLIINFNRQLPEDLLSKFRAMVNRRAAGEPLQYITGHQEFFGLDFEVTPDVLIPRPETELIVEETIRIVQKYGIARPVIVDVGAGSGAIAVALARELSAARVIASDISEAALRVARHNAARHGLGDRVGFVASDLLDAFAEEDFADFILSNPPYVSEEEMPSLQREVRDWEPRLALTDSNDGLSLYRRLLKGAPSHLKPGGHLICEMGYIQSERISAMVNHNVWGAGRLLDDLQGIPRTIVLQKL